MKTPRIYRAPETKYLIRWTNRSGSQSHQVHDVYMGTDGDEHSEDSAPHIAAFDTAAAARRRKAELGYDLADVVTQPKPDVLVYRADTYRANSGTHIGYYLSREDAQNALRDYPNEVDFAEGDFAQIIVFVVEADLLDGINLADEYDMALAWETGAIVNEIYLK